MIALHRFLRCSKARSEASLDPISCLPLVKSARLNEEKGVKLWEVSGYVGASVETIQRVYGHHAPDYLENARKAME